MKPVFETELGKLYQADCLDLLGEIEDDAFDLVFADPPFNLNKDYGKGIKDSLEDEDRWRGVSHGLKNARAY